MNDIVDRIICCPDCGGDLRDDNKVKICCSCGRNYEKFETGSKSIPVLFAASSKVGFSSKAGQYGLEEKTTLFTPLARFLWPPEPTRFYGDLQYTGIVNYHKAVRDFLKIVRKDPSAVVLDVGGGRRRLASNVINIDLFVSNFVDIAADANFLPIKKGCVDGVILQSVLEHTDTYEEILTRIYDVMKNGASLFCEVPFFYPIHSECDFVRFTPKMLMLTLKKIGFEISECRQSEGPFSALSLSIRTVPAIILSFGYKKVFTLWYILFGWLTFWIKYLDIFYPPTKMSEWVVPMFYVIARKKVV